MCKSSVCNSKMKEFPIQTKPVTTWWLSIALALALDSSVFVCNPSANYEILEFLISVRRKMMLLNNRGYSYIINQLVQTNQTLKISMLHSSSEPESEIVRIVRLVNDHPFPDKPLRPTLHRHMGALTLSTPLVERVLGRLFAAHSNGLKAYEFFKYCLESDVYVPSSDAFEKTLHILTRMRYFSKAWELMELIKRDQPHLLTLKSMSIMLSRIAKFKSYEETLEAFVRMESHIFLKNRFSTDEFNVLLRAFCTQRRMEEARSIFNKMHSRFPPNIKTMNILLLGFKESGDISSVELFYHDMVRRGFTPNNITYNIRIDAYCKKGHFGDALRLFEEMERVSCLPTLQTITTLIHGAGIARNIIKAKQLFDEISKRDIKPDVGSYNALLNSLVRSKDIVAAKDLMDEMLEKKIKHDNITYHTVFLGLMRSRGIDGVSDLYSKMIDENFVPKTRTVVMLMKFFCENGEIDLGLDLWKYLVKKGNCPHSHALDLLVTGLCARGRVDEAFDCSKQLLERSRAMSELAFEMVKNCFAEMGELERLEELEAMMGKLKLLLPSSTQYAIITS